MFNFSPLSVNRSPCSQKRRETVASVIVHLCLLLTDLVINQLASHRADITAIEHRRFSETLDSGLHGCSLTKCGGTVPTECMRKAG